MKTSKPPKPQLGRRAGVSKAIVGLAVVALAATAYFFRPLLSHRPPPPAEAVSGYVDSATCRGCHAEIAKSYALTGMGRSFYRARPENTVEDYNTRTSFYHQPSGRYYTMSQRDGKPYQRRHQLGFDGKETNVIEKTVDYVVGSGNHARTYLHAAGAGKFV